jgi:hypothetical protein
MGVWQGVAKGFPKVSNGPALPYPYMPCGWAARKTVLQPFRGWTTCGRRVTVVFPFGHSTPYPYEPHPDPGIHLERAHRETKVRKFPSFESAAQMTINQN